ncbi:hypothetical protein NYR60_02900 [Actinobacillus genomosp. 2]|uniref:hypothetical protein n=1 Tax=Actinobacillus genomosp. 2 TaxID=230709 RepID=UPI002442B3A3|nr:hypothetical protein [Actinobacillus genomosp. 2]WGE32574.1 hypothetical protein NYR60_02900 [Actinobacillus genomosp. 2]
MKKLLLLSFISCALSMPAFSMTEKAQKEVADMIATGDYQKMRNVAYGMEQGMFGHDENPITACALRRVIILAHQDKVDDSDYANEAIGCKKIKPTENRKAWEITLTVLKSALSKK